MSIHIVADANIPFVSEEFSDFGDITLVPGHEIGPNAVKTADVALVRSVTRIDARSLGGSPVQFVGSATAGIDHVDLSYLTAEGIGFVHAPGSNAGSVVEYVLAGLFSLAARKSETLAGKTVGIIGCGEVGSRLAARLANLGIGVVQNDPPLARLRDAEDCSHAFVDLNTLLEVSDIVTTHVPLTREGPDQTYHLLGTREFERLKNRSWILNTSRGGVIDESALKIGLRTGRVSAAILDVWETEPVPDPELHEMIDIGTPHVAGYSIDAKRACTRAIAEGTRCFFNVNTPRRARDEVVGSSALQLPAIDPAGNPTGFYHAVIGQMYSIESDHDRLMSARGEDLLVSAPAFRRLRNEYPIRRSFERFHVLAGHLPEKLLGPIQSGLGIGIV